MDWSTFVPTLLATFAGVIVSVILSFSAYRLWDWYKTRSQRATIKYVLSLEVVENLGRLKSIRAAANKVVNGESSIQTWFSFASNLKTPAYNDAFTRGKIRKLDDDTLEKALMDYSGGCERFNRDVNWITHIVYYHHGFEDVPQEKEKLLLQKRLPVIDYLIDHGWQILRMMNENIGESDITAE